MTRTLRDYQLEANTQIYKCWAERKRPILVMPTGGGKSFTAMDLIKKVHEVYRVALVVRKRGLVQQLVDDAKKFNLPYGVLMAGHDEYAPERPIQICSIDTLTARENYPKAQVVLIDEADESLSPSFCKFIDHYKDANIMGMTATPYNGLYHFNEIVSPITALELKERGVLVDYKYYVPECAIDTSGLDIKNGKYNQKQVTTKSAAIVGDCVKVWYQFGEYRPTLVFAANIEHSKSIADSFNKAGIKAAHCDADTPLAERIEIIGKLKNGLITVICNVGIFCRGTDIPEIGTIIDAGATLSINKHVQKMGRGSRQNPFFKDCIYIDMAGNILNLGHFYMDRSGLINLNKPHRLNRTLLDIQEELMRQCVGCFGCFEPVDFKDGFCPRCGKQNKSARKLRTAKGNLKEISPEELERQAIIKGFRKLFWQYTNLPFHKERYKNDKSRIRKAVLLKLSRQYGIKVYEVMK